MLTMILMLMVIAVASFGFIVFVAKWDQRVANVSNDSVNLTGITYTGETYNATNDIIHQVAAVFPNFIWIIIIFLIIVFLTIFAVALKRG